MVSKSPGLNESEPNKWPRKQNLDTEGRAPARGEGRHGMARTGPCDMNSGGVEGQHGDKDMLSQLEKPPRPRHESGGSKEADNCEPRKTVEGGGWGGAAVAAKRRNGRGAKGPCCLHDSNRGRQGCLTKGHPALQDLGGAHTSRRRLNTAWRFWGLYVHVWQNGDASVNAYCMAKKKTTGTGHRRGNVRSIEQSGEESFFSNREKLSLKHVSAMTAHGRMEIPQVGH